MAATFNALTESVAASQRDAAQRERLSALGRLSTVIAHEIRNPLMIIKGALRPLLKADGSAADRRDAAHDINGEVDRLNRVVNEVLDFARPIRFDLAPADVNDICRSARDAVLAAAPTPDVALELDPGLRRADHRRRAGAHRARQPADQRPGRGRRPRRRRRRAGGPDHRRGSTAAGSRSSCAIAASASRATTSAGCSIHTSRRGAPAAASAWRSPRTWSRASAAPSPATSTVGAGTELRVELPDRAAGDATTMTLTGRVLLVDDEEKIVKTLGRALREEGHLVTTTSRAVDGQRLLAEQSFDLLIIDYRMPDRSGMDVVKELVATTPESERPAIVMMTAHGSVESAVEAMKLGAHDYLQKPFEVDELLLTARRALAGAARPHRADLPAQRARRRVRPLRHRRPVAR